MKAMFDSAYKVIDTRKFNTWCKYRHRIDTYGKGCEHNCGYCYARGLLEFRKNWNPVSPARSYITEIEKSISLMPQGEVVRIGSMTDCFQPIEKKYRITYETIKILNHYKINYLIVTKGCTVSDDEYLKLYDAKLAHFQISISGTDSEKCLKYENTKSPLDRIKSIEKLSASDFDVSVRLSPFISQHTDIKIINKIKCKKILIEFLKVNHWVEKNLKIDYSKYILKYGGHKNLELEEKMRLVNSIDGFEQKSVGEYVKSNHEYFSQNVNFNKNDCCNLDIKLQQPECEQLDIKFS